MYKEKKSGTVGIIITIILLIIIVAFSNVEKNKTFFENVASKLVMPVQNSLVYLKNKINKNTSFFTNISTLKEENENLKAENSKLEQEVRELENLKTENETLKEYLSLAEKYSEYSTISGYVIDKNFSNYSKTIILNVGSKDGVEKDMAVIADEGLVGQVISVTESTAKVRTIIDTANSVSCLLSTNKDSMVCKGTLSTNNRELEGMYISTEGNIVKGDSVDTSGLGGIYPKGIHVGTIKSIDENSNITDRTVIVETAVDFNKLNTVLVVKN